MTAFEERPIHARPTTVPERSKHIPASASSHARHQRRRRHNEVTDPITVLRPASESAELQAPRSGQHILPALGGIELQQLSPAHATVAITLDIYSHVIPGMDELAASTERRT